MKDKDLKLIAEAIEKSIWALTNQLSSMEPRQDKTLAAFEGWARAYIDGYLPGREFLFEGRLGRGKDIKVVFAEAVNLASQRFYKIKDLSEENFQLRNKIQELEKK